MRMDVQQSEVPVPFAVRDRRTADGRKMEQRKRKISVEGPPDEVDDEVIGPLPVGGGGGTKKRRGMRLIWREF